jgi:hypothetical protein
VCSASLEHPSGTLVERLRKLKVDAGIVGTKLRRLVLHAEKLVE